jgi:DNA-binding transcriptional ArsR family regulator
LKEPNLKSLAFLSKSLGDENRLRIILSLKNGKKSVSQIVEELNLSQPLVSHHLRELRRSLLVTVERQGPFIYYGMRDGRVIKILQDLEGLARDLLTERKTF